VARDLLRHHLARRPGDNPFPRFAVHLHDELPDLLTGDAERYHAYAFATSRMAGAGFEILAGHVDWLLGADGRTTSQALRRIVEGTKVLSFKLARRRVFDPREVIDAMSADWEIAMGSLDELVGV
jgi:hypothetical protein